MLKKLALLMAVIMVLSVCFVACGKKTEDDDPTNKSLKIEDTANDEEEYFYNPKLVAAYRVSDTVVRVKFSPRVTSPIYDSAAYIYASTEVLGGTKIKATKSVCLDPKVLGEDQNSSVYGTYYDITFESAIPQDGYICFEETVGTDNDGSLDNVLYDDTGSGLYASYRPADKSAPVAAIKYTNVAIEAPTTPTVLLRAYLADAESGLFIVEFSKPVAVIAGKAGEPGAWTKHCYISDNVIYTAGSGEGWRYDAAFDPNPVDVQLGADGLMYASKWEFTMNGSDYPESGVFRIVENSDYSDEKIGVDDNTLGRIVIGIDGTPLEATEAGRGSQDISHCTYSSDPAYFIKGLSN